MSTNSIGKKKDAMNLFLQENKRSIQSNYRILIQQNYNMLLNVENQSPSFIAILTYFTLSLIHDTKDSKSVVP